MLAEGSPLPDPGQLSIATDGFGYPRAVIETVTTQRLPFHAMTADLAAREGRATSASRTGARTPRVLRGGGAAVG